MKKRLISLILVICIAVSLIVISAVSDDADIPTFEQYKAGFYIENINFPFYVDNFSTPYRAVVENRDNSPVYQSLLEGWKLATFDLHNDIFREQAYCETLLFDILYEGAEAPCLCDKYEEAFKATQASCIKKISELGTNINWTENVKDLSVEEVQKISDYFNTLDELQDTMGAIGDVAKVIKYASDVEDVLYKLCKISMMQNMSDEMVTLLYDIKANTDSEAMRNAAEDMITYCSGLVSDDAIINAVAAKEGAKAIIKYGMDIIWDNVLDKCTVYGLAIKAGQEAGKAFCNIFCSTDKDIELYYKMQALYHFEDSLTAVLNKYKEYYLSDNSYENARLFNTAFEMLMNTHLLSIDYSKQYYDVLFKDGVFNQTSFWFREDKYDRCVDMMNSLEYNLKDMIRIAHMNAYEFYAETYFADDETSPAEKLENVESIEVLPNLLNLLQEESYIISNQEIKKDTVLYEDLETFGNLVVSADFDVNGNTYKVGGDLIINQGTVDIAGGTLEVEGDLIQQDGSIEINKGKIIVKGDYRIQSKGENSAKETVYTSSFGNLHMDYDEDLVEVKGSFITQSNPYYSNSYTAGTMKVGGDFVQLDGDSNGSYPNFSAKGTHTVILNGTGSQKISFESGAYGVQGYPLCFNNLKIENDDVTVENYFSVRNMLSDAEMVSENAVLERVNLNGHTLKLNGDVIVDDDVDVAGGTLEVEGDLIQQDGSIEINKGKIIVRGDYRIQSKGENSAKETVYTSSFGTLHMDYDEDLVEVKGSFITQSNPYYSNSYTAGTMKVGRDFVQLDGDSNGSYPNFYTEGTHTVILNGTDPQKISFESGSYGESGFNNLEISKNAVVSTYGYFNVRNRLSIAERADVCLGGEVRIGNLANDAVVSSSNLVIKELVMPGRTLKICGDATLSADVALKKGTLEITGDLDHLDGMITIGKGNLIVGGDYRIQDVSENSAGDIVYTSSNGTVDMEYEEDSIVVGGNFFVRSDGYNTLEAGTIEIAGNFEQGEGYSYNFTPTGTHKVILNGTEVQHVSIASYPKSYINILELKQGKSKYVFNPEPCWKDIINICDNLYIADSICELQSPHPYKADCDDMWLYTIDDAASINVTFSTDTITEYEVDYIYIYSADGSVVGKYTGEELAGKTVTVPGDTVKIKLQSNDSICDYGFAVTGIVDNNADFAITSQPKDLTAASGTIGKFAIKAKGTGLSYQWQYQNADGGSWVNSSSASGKSATFSVSVREAIDGYKYRCIITDENGNSVKSNTATLTVIEPTVEITKQPSNLTATSGTTGKFSVTATGTGLTYQWQYQNASGGAWVNSSAASGKTDTFSVSVREAIDGYKYRCIVTDANGNSVTSSAVTLTVKSAAPVITKQPANLYAKGGTTGYISVTATGTGLTYQWQYQKTGTSTWTNSTAASATTAKFAVSAREAINGYKYRCVIKDANGNSVTSNTVTLSVFAITKQPVNLTAKSGTTGKLSVTAIGKGLTYQWQYQKTGATTWTNSTSTSATTATFSVSAREAIDGYKYRCIIKDSAGNSITSNVVKLSVTSASIAITKQPANLYAKGGTTGYISVTATGTGLKYQWQYQKTGTSTWTNSTAASATTAKFAVSAREAINGYKYRCVIKDANGNSVTSNTVTLSVFAITKQPVNLTAASGTTGKLSVTAIGKGLTYQWQYQKTGTTTWVNSTAASGTTATFSVSARAAINGYKYRCIVKDSAGNSITSNVVKLTVS